MKQTMMAPFAPNEVERLSCLAAYDLIGPGLEAEFNEIAALVANTLDAPSASVTIIGLDEVWIRGCVGTPPTQSTRRHAFCSHAILQDEPLVIGDLSADARFANAPQVTAAPHLRFYAGAPISTHDNHKLGTVCVVDPKPRSGITAPQRDALQGLARIAGFAFDQRRRRIEAVTQAQTGDSLVQRALQLSEVTPFRTDASGNIVSIQPCSPEIARLARPTHGVSLWINYVHPEDIETLLQLWRSALLRLDFFSAEFRIQDLDGEWRWFHARARPDRSPQGAGDWFGTLEDVHERRQNADRIARLEAALSHFSRVSAMGTMASTLAHELNQPLAAITNFIRAGQRMVKASNVGSPELAEAMHGAAEAAMRAGGIVRGMRELVAHGEVQRRRVDLQPLLREAYRIAILDLPVSGLKVRFDFDTIATTAMVDPLQIQQVVINLVRNAVQAMEKAEIRQITIGIQPLPNDQCEITVGDTGPGIDPIIAARLFSSFNSSKGDGMGIGLSISRTIVEAHGGRITAERRQAGGMLFRIRFPSR